MPNKPLNKKLLAVIIVAVIVVVGLAYYFFLMPKGPQEIVFASTQLAPSAERAFVEGTLLKEFKDETGINVQFVPISYADLVTRLEAEMKAGKVTISVVGDLHGGLDLFASKGYLTDLTKFGTLSGRTFPATLEKYSQIHGIKAYIPWMTATYVFVVNKKAFNYLPEGLTKEDVIKGTSKWTYDALLAWAKNIYEKTGEKKLGFPVGPKGLWHRFLHGYLYPSFTGYQVKKFNSPEAAKMWQYLKDLWQYVNPASTTYDALAEPLLKEEVWLAWDHTARIKDAIVQKPDEFVVVPVPAGPKGRGFILVVAGLAIPKDAPNQDAAWKLIEYLTRPEVQVKVLQNIGFFPSVNEAVGKIPEGPLKIMAQGVNAQISASDAILAMIPSLGAKGGEFTGTYRNAFERIVLKGEDIQSVLSELGPKLQKLFEETGAPLPPPDA
ncbi:MAG TPA: carbohydrate ABC transporter substrate-binding protein [Thermofilum sp.]|nr:carbohydrate ABC transporter substrate-binding protein [Thermofilum sp.]